MIPETQYNSTTQLQSKDGKDKCTSIEPTKQEVDGKKTPKNKYWRKTTKRYKTHIKKEYYQQNVYSNIYHTANISYSHSIPSEVSLVPFVTRPIYSPAVVNTYNAYVPTTSINYVPPYQTWLPSPTIDPTFSPPYAALPLMSPIVMPAAFPVVTTPSVFIPTSVLPPVISPALSPSPYYPYETMYSDVAHPSSCCEYVNPSPDSSDVVTDYEDPLSMYFQLPPNLFVTPRSVTSIDFNKFIELLCSIDVLNDVSWILDLELGHPKTATDRLLASYDIFTARIVCYDTDVIHPGWSDLDDNLKRVLLHYYDSIISSWYVSFSNFYGTRSVELFKNWLKPVLDVFGLCWC